MGTRIFIGLMAILATASASSQSVSPTHVISATVVQATVQGSMANSVHSAGHGASAQASNVVVQATGVSIQPTPSGGAMASSAAPAGHGHHCEGAKNLKMVIDGPSVSMAGLVKNASSTNYIVTGGAEGPKCAKFKKSTDGGSSWTDFPALNSFPSGKGLLVPGSTLIKAVSKDCGDWGDEHHCYGHLQVNFRVMAAGALTGPMIGYGSTNASDECVVKSFLFPNPNVIKCAECDLKQNFTLNFDEDSGCTGFTLSNFIDHKGNNNDTGAFSRYKSSSLFNDTVRAEFKAAIQAMAGGFDKYIEVQAVEQLKVKWFFAKNSTAKRTMVAGKTLIPQDAYICLKPDKDFHGNRTINFHCVFKSKATGKVVARSSKAQSFVIKINSVADRALLKKLIYPLPHLNKVYASVDTNGTLAKTITKASASHPDSDGDMGLAVIDVGTTSHGTWEAQCAGAWETVNTTGGNTFLIPANSRIRFKLSGDNFWTRSEGARSVFMAVKTWDMSDNSTWCGTRTVNMTASTAYSSQRGQITQLRYGCHGPGTAGGADDACGVCGGDNSTCTGCDGVPARRRVDRAKYDMCGNCTGGSTNKTFGFFLDCYKTCGKFQLDSCGFCQKKGGRYNADKYKDCHGDCGGKAKINKCGVCVGGNSGNGTNAGLDGCGVCGGDNSTCLDCAGVPNGGKTTDICGNCKTADDSTRNVGCGVKLGSLSKMCLKVGGNALIKIPAAGLGGGHTSASCSLGGVAATSAALSSDKKAVDIVYANVSSAVSGQSASLTLTCVIDGGAGSVNAASTILAYKEYELTVTSVSPSEAEATMTVQNLTITGTNFVNSTDLKCVVKKKGGNVVVDAVFISTTSVRCDGVPGNKHSEAYQVSVDTCGTGTFDSSKAVTFTFTKPMPAVSSARFATCTTFFVTFPKPVEPTTNPLDCNHFFNTTSNQTALGNKYRCGMQGPFNLKVSMRGSPTFVKDQTLRITYGALQSARAAKTTYATVEEVITVLAPSNAANPNVGIMPRGDVEIGSCDNYVVRAKSKVRGGLTYSWTAAYESPIDATSLQNSSLATMNTALSGITAPRISNAGNSTMVGTKIVFSVTVTDCFGNSATASTKITKVNKNLPRLLVTTPKVSSRVNRDIRVRTKTSLGCAAGAQLVYTWETSPAVDGLTTDKKELVIPKGTLTAGQTYTATVTVAQLADPSLYSTGQAEITVVSLPLRGKVKGPASVGSTGSIEMKTRVIDPDDSSDTLSYQWNVFDSNGDGVLDPSNNQPISLGSSATATIQGSKFTAGETYTCQVTFTKGQRTLEATQSFSVVAGDPAQVVSQPPLEAVNPSDKIAVFATIKSNQGGTFTWAAVDMGDDASYGYLDLADSDNYFGTITGSYGRKDRFVTLVIRNDILEGGISYKFQLTATNADGVVSAAEAVVTTNAAPTQGVLAVSPSSGTAMSTDFTYTVSEGCVDDDGVEFRFGYTVGSGASMSTVTYPTTTDSEFTTSVGQGTLDMFVKCFDPSGATSSTSGVAVTGNQPTIDASFMTAQNDKMDELANSGNAEDLAAFAQQFIETANAAGSDTDSVKEFKSTATTNMCKAENLPTDVEGKNNLATSFKSVTAGGAENFDSSLVTNTQTAVATLLSGSSSKRRRRRAVTHANLNAMTPTQAESYLVTQANLIAPTAYDSTSMTNKGSAIAAVDDVAASMCKSYSQGENRVIAKSELAVVNVVQQDFSAVNTTWLDLGCPGSCDTCSDCPTYMKGEDEVLLGQALLDSYVSYSCDDADGVSTTCAGACVTSAIFQHDLRSSAANSSVLSNVNRIQLYNPLTSATLDVTTLSTAMKVKIASTGNATYSYLCVRWDSSSTSWVTTNVETDDINGAVVDGVYYVTCSLSYLADVMLIEGPEPAATTEAATTTAAADTTTAAPAVTTTAAPAATTLSPANYPVKIKFSYNVVCSTVFDSSNKTSVTATMKTAVATALNISESTMEGYAISCGSVVNEWTQNSNGLPAGTTVASLVTTLKNQVAAQTFAITIGGVSMSSNNDFTSTTINPYATTTKASTGLSTGAIAGIAVGAVVLIIVIIVIAVCCKKKKAGKGSTKVAAHDDSHELESRQNSATANGKQNPGYSDSP